MVIRWIYFMILISSIFSPLSAQSDTAVKRLQSQLDNLLNTYELAEYDRVQMRRDLDTYGEIDLEILGQWMVLVLEPNNLYAPDFVSTITTEKGIIQEPFPEVTTYQGYILGDETSRVSIQITDQYVSGVIWQGDDVFFVRPASRFTKGKSIGLNVVYRDTDVFETAKAVCGLERHHKDAETIFQNVDLAQKALASDQGYRVQIATEADGEFTDDYPGQNINQMLAEYVNELDVIWKENLNLRLQLTFQNTYTLATNPYTGSFGHGPEVDGPFGTFLGNAPCSDTSVVGVWEQFRDLWNKTRTSVNRDIAVLFSGHDLRLCPTAVQPAGYELFGTAGDFGTICTSPRRDYVLMEEYTLNTAGLMAHEIGHSLDATHVGGSICNLGGPVGSVMCGTVESGSDYYASFSQTQIGNHIAAHNSCLTPIHPEIRVRQAGVDYADGSTFTFPSTDVGTPIERNFKIINDGPAELRIDNPSTLVTGSGFLQLTSPPASLLQGESAIFRVRFTAINSGWQTGAITIQNNDLNEDPYNITLNGLVTTPCETIPPTAAITFPSNGQWLNTGPVTLTATASDNVHVLAVSFEVNGQVPGGNADLAPPYTYTWNATPGTHTIRARAMDTCSNIGYSSYVTVTVSDTPSTVPNFVARIGGVIVNNQTFYDNTPRLDFTWSHASDGSGIERYQIVVQPTTGGWLYQPHVLYPATSHSINTSLTYGVTYSYHIRAKNNLGNWGPFINAGQFTIQQPTPSTVPNFTGKIGGLNINNLTVFTTSPRVDFTWSHASDPTGIERYQIIIQPTTGGWLYQPHILYPSSAHNIQTSGLIPGKSYSTHIRAKNNAGVWGPFVNGGTFHVASTATKDAP